MARNNGKMYCSYRCAKTDHHGPGTHFGEDTFVTVNCLHCDKPKRLKRYMATRRSGRVFCNRKCFNAWKSIHLIGSNSPAWRGGKTHSYGKSHWKRIRKLVRQRDGHRCQSCGFKHRKGQRAFDVHHVKPFDAFTDPNAANNMANLVTLCRKCHAQWNPNKLGFRPPLQLALV